MYIPVVEVLISGILVAMVKPYLTVMAPMKAAYVVHHFGPALSKVFS